MPRWKSWLYLIIRLMYTTIPILGKQKCDSASVFNHLHIRYSNGVSPRTKETIQQSRRIIKLFITTPPTLERHNDIGLREIGTRVKVFFCDGLSSFLINEFGRPSIHFQYLPFDFAIRAILHGCFSDLAHRPTHFHRRPTKLVE